MSGSVEFSPFLPIPVIAAFVGLSLLLCVIIIGQSGVGALWRAFVALAITVTLLNPAIIREKREPLSDTVVLLVDRTASQKVGNRKTQTDLAVRYIRDRLKSFRKMDIREFDVTDSFSDMTLGGNEGSLLLNAFRQALGTIPQKQVAGAIIVSDGQAHDGGLIDRMKGLGLPAHIFLTGQPNEVDRRLIIERAPSYGIVGKNVAITYRVEDRLGQPVGTDSQIAQVTLKDGYTTMATAKIPVGRTDSMSIPLSHAGSKVFTLEVAKRPNELSIVNNRVLLTINGIRERLHVLLVSGQPHAGERVWRNLLKSDPAVDLVHFTILRPPEKDDFTPLKEISLISFPTRELFEAKIKEFDLVIFDRYAVRDVLPPSYLRNIIDYVRQGGALLLAVGPEFANEQSLFHTPLGEILPVAPTGNVIERGFRPKVTEVGNFHPVTAVLSKARATRANRGTKDWGRWFRQIEVAPKAGHILMHGPNRLPLLVIHRIEGGRVATILSDHIWLWARGFEGGGPHAELMRRLAHWLMQEPDLEEEQLRAHVRDGKLNVNRRSLQHKSTRITVTKPSGVTETYSLPGSKSGDVELKLPAPEAGLYRISDGNREALAAAGPLNPIEFEDLRATSKVLGRLSTLTGGGVHWIRDGLPDIRKVQAHRDLSGKGWIGLIDNNSYTVVGLTKFLLLPPLLLMIGVLGFLMMAWWKEGRA